MQVVGCSVVTNERKDMLEGFAIRAGALEKPYDVGIIQIFRRICRVRSDGHVLTAPQPRECSEIENAKPIVGEHELSAIKGRQE